jgi:hypothetical protein
MKARKAKARPWKLLFDPETINQSSNELKLEDYQLSVKELKKWAIKCSSMREAIRSNAL